MTDQPRRYHKISLLYNTLNERQSLEPLAPVAERYGYEVEFANTPPADGEQVEIGIYAGHARYPDMPRVDPTAAAFSVAMVHDLGQSTWPFDATADDNLWLEEPWDTFDVGILPGRSWSEAWRIASGSIGSRPRLGVFELGYTKADPVFNGDPAFVEDVKQMRETLGLADRPSIVLAPSWDLEDNNRFHDFTRALGDLELNLIVKYYAGEQALVRRLASEYDNSKQNLYFAHPNSNIMTCLALSDVIVSDESSCLAEALLFDMPGISVIDWDSPAVPDPWNVPQRPCRPVAFAQQVKSAEIRDTVLHTLEHLESYRQDARRVRDEYFTNLGTSAERIIEVVDALANLPVLPLSPTRH